MGKYKAWQNADRRSSFEDRIEDALKHLNVDYSYETDKFKYEVPASIHTYTADFTIAPTKFIEAKGEFTAADRKKMILVRDTYPGCKFYLLFQRNNTLSKKSKTTYLDWAAKNSFEAALFNNTEVWHRWLEKTHT